jgi:glycosyltransferase 2 family protein
LKKNELIFNLSLFSAPPFTEMPIPANNIPVGKKSISWLLVFAFLLAAVLLYFTLRGLDWASFWEAITGGHYEILLLTIPLASINYFIRAVRWSTLVNTEKKVPLLSIFWANMVGYLGNAYLPARAGELIRSAFLGQKSGTGTSFVFATALVERLLDVIALVLIGSIAVLLQSQVSSLLAQAIKVMAAAGVIGLAIVLVAPFQEKWITSLIARIPLPSRINQIVTEQVGRFLVGMRSLHNLPRLAGFIILTAAIWLLDGLGTMIGVHIISQSLNLGQALILLAALGLSSAIPSTPGYIGVYQFVAVSVLVPFGFSRPSALAYILISQVVGYLVVSFWGLLGLWQINRSKVVPV